MTLNDDGDGFAFALRAPGPAFALATPPVPAPEGTVLEVCPAAITVAAAIARRLAGLWRRRAQLRLCHRRGRHRRQLAGRAAPREAWRICEDPGLADLSAHVDFGAIARAAREAGAVVHGPIAQGELLERLGIQTRAEALQRRATPEQSADIAAAMERLLDLQQMGTLFKALAMTAPGLATPAGFP